MEKSVFVNGNHHHSFSSSAASQRHVSYRLAKNGSIGFLMTLERSLAIVSLIGFMLDCCGSCGYELNLSSGNRNISTIGSKYGKSMKRGIISFLDIDESRFTQVDEFQCVPHFSKKSMGIFRHRTKLLCRKCGNPIGTAYDDKTSVYPRISNGSDSPSVRGASGHRKYNVRIRSLQPSSGEESGVPLFS